VGKSLGGKRWFWRFLLVLGIALVVDAGLDDKLILALIAAIWIGACSFSLRRLRRAGQAPSA
jgi:drug/metabolite transporter (DMT)-like permease